MEETAARETLSILIVDDDLAIQAFLSELLQGEGHQTLSTGSGQQALKHLDRGPFDLVISEMSLTDLSGVKLLQEVKRQSPDTEVVLMTGFPDLNSALAALRCGAYDYLLKNSEDFEAIARVVARAGARVRQNQRQRDLVEKAQRENQRLASIHQKLQESSMQDKLTGLYNHCFFQEALEMELLRGRRFGRTFSVIFLELTPVAKTWLRITEATQATVLSFATGLIQTRMRNSDTVTFCESRTFRLLLPDTPAAGARKVLHDLERLLRETPLPGEGTNAVQELKVTLGMATFPDDGEEAIALLDAGEDRLRLAGRKR